MKSVYASTIVFNLTILIVLLLMYLKKDSLSQRTKDRLFIFLMITGTVVVVINMGLLTKIIN